MRPRDPRTECRGTGPARQSSRNMWQRLGVGKAHRLVRFENRVRAVETVDPLTVHTLVGERYVAMIEQITNASYLVRRRRRVLEHELRDVDVLLFLGVLTEEQPSDALPHFGQRVSNIFASTSCMCLF